jgi:hypothetical protein
VPTIVVIYLDRPVVPEISQFAKALLAEYGASDASVLDVVFGKANPAASSRSSFRHRWMPFEIRKQIFHTTRKIRFTRLALVEVLTLQRRRTRSS